MNRLRDCIATTLEERNSYKKKAAELAKAYKKHLPYEEGGYRESAKLMAKKPEAMLKLLNDALSNELISSCPTCAFEKAEILFKQKKYKEAREAINRSLDDSINQTQGGVKENYLLFLRGLCDYALLLQGLREGQPIKEETVLGIYADFNKALRELTLRSSFFGENNSGCVIRDRTARKESLQCLLSPKPGLRIRFAPSSASWMRKQDSTELRCPSLSTVMGGSSGTTVMLSLKRSGSTVSFSTTRPPGKPR